MIAFFIFVCVASILAVVFIPKQKFSEMQILDESQILIHNGQGHQFKHGENKLFEGKTISEVKQLFLSSLSDTNNIGSCKTSKRQDAKEDEENDIELPEQFDWREQYP